ncbi:MAG: LacI family DNA-binding transcriptional regulator [Microbacterium sp.]
MVVSVREVAKEAGVSVGTVSNVLNRPERVSEKTVERVHAAVAKLGYVRNDAARQLRAGRSKSIGLVVLDVGNPFFTEVARGAEDRAADAGMVVLVGNSDESSARESTYLAQFREQRVSGVLISPTSEDLGEVQKLSDAGIPVILVDREPDGLAVGSVSVDDVEGGHLAAGHLLSLGRRRLAFLGGPSTIRQVSDRLAGARKAVAEYDGATIEVIERPSLSVMEGRAAGEELLERDAADRPDAIFCANDLLAVGVLQALVMTGELRVPEDIALVGYDDIAFAAATVVSLTSVRQPARHIGEAAVELLLEQLEDEPAEPRSVTFRPELVIRDSTGQAASR